MSPKHNLICKEALKRPYKASDFMPNKDDISPNRSELKKKIIKRAQKNVMYSQIHNQVPLAEDYFTNTYAALKDTVDMDIIPPTPNLGNANSKVKEIVKRGLIKLPI